MKKIFELAKPTIVLIGIIPFFSFKTTAQCDTPAYTSCSDLPDNAIPIDPTSSFGMNSGIYYYSGGAATLSISYYNGGTLVICGGPVSINGLNPGGNVIITAGSSLTINGSVNLQNSNKIFNMGSVTITGGMHVNGNGIVNDGMLTVGGEIRFNSGGRMCMASGAALSAGSIYNDQNNSVTVPSGNACISYSGSFGGNNPITNNPNLVICQASGASNPGNSSSGNATLISNCTNCAAPLSLTLVSFELERVAEGINIEWVTLDERNVAYYALEYADVSGKFQQIKTVNATIKSNHENQYSFLHENKKGGLHYYRLSEIDFSGNARVMETKVIEQVASSDFMLFPNPVNEGQETKIIYEPGESGVAYIEFYSPVGALIQHVPLDKHTSSYEVTLPKGQYIVRLVEDENTIRVKSLIVL